MPVAGDPVLAQEHSGSVIARSVTRADGDVNLDLAPGTYTIIEAICGVNDTVVVLSATTTDVTINIPSSC